MEKEKVSPERFVGMQAGNAELQSRLLDLIRGGLVELDLAPPQSRLSRDFVPQYFEEFAARMVDAQLGSIGKRIRTWATFRELIPIRGMKNCWTNWVRSICFQKLLRDTTNSPTICKTNYSQWQV